MENDKIEATRLRKLGKSYNEINKILRIPKSTLSYWLKNLPISQDIKNNNITRAKIKWAENIIRYNKLKAHKKMLQAQKLINDSTKEIPKLRPTILKLLGVALYWAEGYKRAKWAALFCNSDPVMVKLMMRFFREICKVPENKFRPQVQIHLNISKEDAENYWAKIAQLDKNLFRKPISQISKASKQKRPPRILPYGTFRIGIADVKILYKIKGWIKGLEKQTGL